MGRVLEGVGSKTAHPCLLAWFCGYSETLGGDEVFSQL